MTGYCVEDKDCLNIEACMGGVCVNPCEGWCKDMALTSCSVTDHLPQCGCPPRQIADPTYGCIPGNDYVKLNF